MRVNGIALVVASTVSPSSGSGHDRKWHHREGFEGHDGNSLVTLYTTTIP